MRKPTAHRAAIRAFREAAGLSQSALAPRAGISQGYLSLIEGGDKQPSEDVLESIASALNVPVEAISYVEFSCPTCSTEAAA